MYGKHNIFIYIREPDFAIVTYLEVWAARLCRRSLRINMVENAPHRHRPGSWCRSEKQCSWFDGTTLHYRVSGSCACVGACGCSRRLLPRKSSPHRLADGFEAVENVSLLVFVSTSYPCLHK
jgi:hypothetical protein